MGYSSFVRCSFVPYGSPFQCIFPITLALSKSLSGVQHEVGLQSNLSLPMTCVPYKAYEIVTLTLKDS